VRTVDAVVMGVYEGNMVATGNMEITSTGRVEGNLKTDSLVISKGGFFNGNVQKIKGTELEKKVPPARPTERRAPDAPLVAEVRTPEARPRPATEPRSDKPAEPHT